MASSRGHARRANVSFTMATGGVVARSASVNMRPRTSVDRIVSKYRGVTTFQSARIRSGASTAWPGSVSAPRARPSPVSGVTAPKAADRTPASCPTRDKICSCTRLPVSRSYPASRKSKPATSTSSVSNPGWMPPACRSDRTKSSPQTTSSTDIATCATTNACRRRSRLGPDLAPSPFMALTRSVFAACKAGTRPKRTAVATASITENATTRQSRRMSTAMAAGITGSSARRPRISHDASTMPPTAPAIDSSRLSVMSWQTMRALPAPTAMRTATSRARASERASSMPATFVQAIASTSPTSPNSRPTNAVA